MCSWCREPGGLVLLPFPQVYRKPSSQTEGAGQVQLESTGWELLFPPLSSLTLPISSFKLGLVGVFT